MRGRGGDQERGLFGFGVCACGVVCCISDSVCVCLCMCVCSRLLRVLQGWWPKVSEDVGLLLTGARADAGVQEGDMLTLHRAAQVRQ